MQVAFTLLVSTDNLLTNGDLVFKEKNSHMTQYVKHTISRSLPLTPQQNLTSLTIKQTKPPL